jgi:hypothetical protein
MVGGIQRFVRVKEEISDCTNMTRRDFWWTKKERIGLDWVGGLTGSPRLQHRHTRIDQTYPH